MTRQSVGLRAVSVASGGATGAALFERDVKLRVAETGERFAFAAGGDDADLVVDAFGAGAGVVAGVVGVVLG